MDGNPGWLTSEMLLVFVLNLNLAARFRFQDFRETQIAMLRLFALSSGLEKHHHRRRQLIQPQPSRRPINVQSLHRPKHTLDRAPPKSRCVASARHRSLCTLDLPQKKNCTLDYFYTVYLKTCMYLIKNLKTWIFVVATMVQIEVCTVCTKICTVTLLYNL